MLNQKKDISVSMKSSAKKNGEKDRKKDENNIKIGKKLQAIRKEQGETQQQLADIMGLTQITISKMETGNLAITLSNLLKIADHYNVSLDYLCKDTRNTTDLDILKKYIGLTYKNLSMNDSEHYNYPVLVVKQAFFEYLFQTYHAHNSIASSNVITMWCKEAVGKFFKQKESGESIAFVPLPPEFIYPDDTKDWKQTDLIREIDNYFRNVIKES